MRLTNTMVYSVFLYDPHKPHGTGLKSVPPMCQRLSVASEPFGLQTNITHRRLVEPSLRRAGLWSWMERNQWNGIKCIKQMVSRCLMPFHLLRSDGYYEPFFPQQPLLICKGETYEHGGISVLLYNPNNNDRTRLKGLWCLLVGTVLSERMRRGVNCSWLGAEIPLSWEFFSVIKDELWLFLIPAGFAVIMLALFLEEVGFFLRHVPYSRRRRLYLWILGMYPVFGLTSIIALYVPRSSSLCSFIASLYHSITLLKFMGLITDFFGGKARMLEILAGEQVSPDPFPCCCCCCLPMIAINRTSLGWMMTAVLQLSVVRTILFFVTLVLWTDEQYDYGDVDYANPNMYTNVIIGVSTFLSFYGHLLFYKATKKALPGYGLRAKFVCIIVVLVLCGLQSGILETMGALEVVPCTAPFSVLMRSQLIYHYSVIVEMFCICLFARHTFRKVEPSLEEDFGLEERPPRGILMEKAVQTEDVVPLRENPWPSWGGTGVSNPDCSSDSSEDSLCKVEHAPLDCFPFPLQPRRQKTVRPENVTDESGTLELPKLTVTADINVVESRNVTVV